MPRVMCWVGGAGWQNFLASITSWLFPLRSTRSRGGSSEGGGKRDASSCLHLQVWRLLEVASSSCKNSKGWAIPVSSCPVGSGFLNIHPASSLLLSPFFQHCFACIISSTASRARDVLFLVYKMPQRDCDLVVHTRKPSTPDSSSSSFLPCFPFFPLPLLIFSFHLPFHIFPFFPVPLFLFFLPSLPSPLPCSSSSSWLDYDGYTYWRMFRQWMKN